MLPRNVRLTKTGEHRTLSISSATVRWKGLGRLLTWLLIGSMLALIPLVMSSFFGFFEVLVDGLLMVDFVFAAAIIAATMLYGLVSIANTTAEVVLSPGQLHALNLTIPLGRVRGVSIQARGRTHVLVATTADNALVIARHRESAPLEAVSRSVTSWLKKHPIDPDAPTAVTVHTPANIQHALASGTQEFALKATTERWGAGRITLISVVLFGLLVSGLFGPLMLVAGLVVVSQLWTHLAPPVRVTLRQNTLQTARHTLSLEAIQRVWIEDDWRGHALMVETAEGVVRVARHRELEPLQVVQVPLERWARVRREAAVTAGIEPDEPAVIPAELHSLRGVE